MYYSKDTLILTTLGYKNITDIQIDDQVYTFNNIIANVLCKEQTGTTVPMVPVYSTNWNKPLYCTADTLFLIEKREQPFNIMSLIPASKLLKSDNYLNNHLFKFYKEFPTCIPGNFEPDKIGSLIGLFLIYGNIIKQKVIFTVPIIYKSIVLDLIAELFKACCTIETTVNVCIIECTNDNCVQFLNDFKKGIPTNWYNKNVLYNQSIFNILYKHLSKGASFKSDWIYPYFSIISNILNIQLSFNDNISIVSEPIIYSDLEKVEHQYGWNIETDSSCNTIIANNMYCSTFF